MKGLILSILGLLLINNVTTAQSTNYPNGVTGCIARWDFASNGIITTLPDVSGNSNNATVYNLSATNGFRGNINTAAAFDGSSSYAAVLSNTQLGPQQITIVALVKFNNYYSGECQGNQIISKGWPYLIPGQYNLGIGDNSYDNDCNTYTPGKDELSVFFGSSSYVNAQPQSSFIDTANWYFFVGTYDGNTVTYYEEVMERNNHNSHVLPIFTESNINASIGTNTFDISIGKHTDPSYPYWFNGYMDELALFDKALSDSEVQSIYDYLWAPQLAVSNIKGEQQSFKLYPNPSNGSMTLNGEVPAGSSFVSVEVLNAIGQSVYKAELAPVANKVEEHLTLPQSIPPGAYVMRIQSGGNEPSSISFSISK